MKILSNWRSDISLFGVWNNLALIAALLSTSILMAKEGEFVDVHTHLWGRPGMGLVDEGGGRGAGGPGGRRGGPGPGRQFHPGFRPGGPEQRNGRPQADYEAAALNLIAHMDKYGVRKSLLMPPPRTEENIDTEELDELLQLAKAHPDRFAVMGGGDVLNSVLHATPANAVTEDIRASFKKKAEGLLAKGVVGLGEIASLHLSFSKKHVFERTDPDHPLFFVLAEVAAKHDVPIDLHMEAVTDKIDLPPALIR
ncbi:MAG: hypothetical protein HYV97_01200 [Bdellovibrio sp.]|nr:hypothetical protein [Bdellovibrio sp.]